MYIQEMLHENSILTRKQNDGKALAELDSKLRELDPNDPVKYDFALFGLGVFVLIFLLVIIFFLNTRCFPQQLFISLHYLLNSFICYFVVLYLFFNKNMHFIGFFTT
jgi:hypothetical protein